MTDDPLHHRLRELSWRRKLTEAEQAELRAWLAAHPEAQADWEAEAGLTEALARLPETPVATNFTARVLQAVELEAPGTPAGLLSGRVRQWWPRWLPRAAFASLLLGVGLFSYHQVLASARRAEMARSVATVCGVPSLPSPEILKDFDAVWALDPAPPADVDLLSLFR